MGPPTVSPYAVPGFMQPSGSLPLFLPQPLPLQLPDTKQRHASVVKPEHGNSRAQRRGPMDEMRQLLRVMTALMPKIKHFVANIGYASVHKVSEDNIHFVLDCVLGIQSLGALSVSVTGAPRPVWGLPQGWSDFIAELCTWATGKEITAEDMRRVAIRKPGCQWSVDRKFVATSILFC